MTNTLGSSAGDTSPETKPLPWRITCCQCGKVETGTIQVPVFAELNPLDTDCLCSTCWAECQAQNAAIIAQHREEAIAVFKRMTHQVPEEMLHFDSDIGNRKLANAIWQNRGKCLFICGAYGTGKTRAAAANILRLVDAGEKARFYRWADLAREYAEVCKSESEKSSEFIKTLCRFDVLLIDDVGKRRLTETAGELLFDLLDNVYLGSTHCRIWLTANLSVDGLSKRFASGDVGSAFAARVDRLIDAGKMLKLEA